MRYCCILQLAVMGTLLQHTAMNCNGPTLAALHWLHYTTLAALIPDTGCSTHTQFPTLAPLHSHNSRHWLLYTDTIPDTDFSTQTQFPTLAPLHSHNYRHWLLYTDTIPDTGFSTQTLQLFLIINEMLHVNNKKKHYSNDNQQCEQNT